MCVCVYVVCVCVIYVYIYHLYYINLVLLSGFSLTNSSNSQYYFSPLLSPVLASIQTSVCSFATEMSISCYKSFYGN